GVLHVERATLPRVVALEQRAIERGEMRRAVDRAEQGTAELVAHVVEEGRAADHLVGVRPAVDGHRAAVAAGTPLVRLRDARAAPNRARGWRRRRRPASRTRSSDCWCSAPRSANRSPCRWPA